MACTLLILLWVRSYYRQDSIYGRMSLGERFHATTYQGRFVVFTGNTINMPGWRIAIGEDGPYDFPQSWREAFRGFKKGSGPNGSAVYVPLWFPVLCMAVFTAVPWVRWHFSVRTMLVGTAIIAALLGAIIPSVTR